MGVVTAMASETDETTPASIYDLMCTDCRFEAVVEGNAFDALDVAKTHREEKGNSSTDHFVEFELREASTGE